LRIPSPSGRLVGDPPRPHAPYVGNVYREGVGIWHHQAREELMLSWRDLIAHGAEVFGCTTDEFLARLAEIVNSGPSAPPAEPSDGVGTFA